MARGRVLAAVALTQSPLRDFPFRQPGLLGKLLYGVTVSVAGIKIHARIDTGRIAPEDRLNPARSIEKIIPLDGRDNRQVGDGARHIFCIVECRCAGVRGLDGLERWLNFGEQATERGEQKRQVEMGRGASWDGECRTVGSYGDTW